MIFPYEMNGHAVGIVLKELVRRATSRIQAERIAFDVQSKTGYDGELNDVLTSADKAAQDVYVKSLRECFPDIGIISEEGFSHPGSNYFTIDPLDGTKAFVRGQSHGIGTMISLVYENEIVSAFIGDINTGEIFGYRPGSQHVHRITKLDSAVKLPDGGEGETVLKGYGMLRDPINKYQPETQVQINKLKNYIVDGASIGTWLARLWKREVQVAFIPPGFETPWDQTPVVGISKKLGYEFLIFRDGRWVSIEPTIGQDIQKRETDMIVIHKNDKKFLLDG